MRQWKYSEGNIELILCVTNLLRRHARACRGHPRLAAAQQIGADGRDKPGHDETCDVVGLTDRVTATFRFPPAVLHRGRRPVYFAARVVESSG
jgi:hypothetical protein